MSLVFKYYGPERSNFFEDPKFRFTYPADLNDPQDCIPNFVIKDSGTLAMEVAARNIPKLILKYGKELTPQVLAKVTKDYQLDLSNDPAKLQNEADIIFKKQLNSTVGILSLTRVSDNNKMWKLYCHDGKGFVIGLDSKSSFFQPRQNSRPDIDRLVNIGYTSYPIEIKLEYFKVPEKLLYSKTIAWSYEQEVRIVHQLSDRDEELSINGRIIHLFAFPKEDIREVIFGYNCSTDLIDKIKTDIQNDSGYKIELKKSSLDQDGGISIKPI